MTGPVSRRPPRSATHGPRRSSARALWALAALAACCALAAGPAPTERELLGIWKMCYEPGLPGVYERSEGYLVFLPGGRYFEIREDCCGGDPIGRETGAYRIEGDRVVLEAVDINGKPYEIAMSYLARERVVLFDAVERPVEAPVLQRGRDLNYGFARIYPKD